MNSSRYLNRECLEDNNDIKYFFGRNGYIDVIDNVMIAHIQKNSSFLADSKFSDMEAIAWGIDQQLLVTEVSLKGMLDHLGVPISVKLQQKLTSRKKFQKEQGKRIGRHIQNSEIIEDFSTNSQ